MAVARLTAIGGGRPTGANVPPRRRPCLGGAGKAAYPAGVQPVLSVHRKFDRSRRPEPGSLLADLSHPGVVPGSVWGVSYLAYASHTKFAGGSLPADAARPADRFDRGQAAAAGRKAF